MLKIIKKYPTIKQIFIFGIIGFTNAIIDYCIYIILTRNFSFWNKYILIANIVSFLIANMFSFFLNKKFSFKDTDDSNYVIKYVKFLIATSFSLLISEMCLYIATRYIHTLDIYGKIIGTILGAIWNFLLYKLVIFKAKKQLSNIE